MRETLATDSQLTLNAEGLVALSLFWELALLSVARFLQHGCSLQLGLTLCTECGSLRLTRPSDVSLDTLDWSPSHFSGTP